MHGKHVRQEEEVHKYLGHDTVVGGDDKDDDVSD
jgi:hypothetical protein